MEVPMKKHLEMVDFILATFDDWTVMGYHITKYI
jgi:hypothetical protein